MAKFDLQDNKIVLPAVGRVKDAVIEITAKHNQSIDEIETNLNELKNDVYGILGLNVTLSADATAGDTELSVNNISYATVGAKFTIDGDDTEYTITAVDEDNGTITIDPELAQDEPQDTELHIKSKIDPEELINLFDEIEQILNKEGSANDIFDALIALARAWNSIEKVVDTYEVLIDQNGDVDLDISKYGFASADDYMVMVSHSGEAPAVLKGLKKDESTVTIATQDLRYFAEDNVKYDGSCDGCATTATVLISYDRTPIDFTLTDLEGNTRTVAE